MSSSAIGDLAFVGPAHVTDLTEFQYVELVSVEGTTATVKLVGPDAEDAANHLAMPLETFQHRLVNASERMLWPGSFVAHPIAFSRTSCDGIDEWSYGVVSGYNTSEAGTMLHVICQDASIRLALHLSTKLIKVDVLNYALQTGARINTTAVGPEELLIQQNKVISLCNRRRSGLPQAVMQAMSVPYAPDDPIPLIRPTSLELVRVRRRHALEFFTAARTRRPHDLYTDPGITRRNHGDANSPSSSAAQVSHPDQAEHRPLEEGSTNLDAERLSDSLDPSDGDIQDVQQLHRPLAKRRRIEHVGLASSTSSYSDDNETTLPRGSGDRRRVFQPSVTDRSVHQAIVRRRHAGKEPLLLLQRAQQSQHLEFIGTPPILCGAYSFGFGVGLSIMHFRRALSTDEVATTENGVNMWDFSPKNSLSAPPKAGSLRDLVGALSAFYKFAQYFYNKDTKRFVGVARDFVISYADTAHPDPVMARLLTHWINCKFSKFRSRLITKGLKQALRIRKEFTRNDEQLVALKEAYPSWRASTNNTSRQRFGATDASVHSSRSHDQQHGKSRIPVDVIASLPKDGDGRQLCLRFLSKAGCNISNCTRGHFRPDTLSHDAKAVISQRWKGLSDAHKDL